MNSSCVRGRINVCERVRGWVGGWVKLCVMKAPDRPGHDPYDGRLGRYHEP